MSPGRLKALSLSEKVDLVPALLSIGFAAAFAAVEYPFRGSARADTYYHHIINALVRKFSVRLSVNQAQCFEPSFADAYQHWCSKHQIPVDIASISPQTDGLWLGSRDAPYVVAFFHGGGFAFDGNDGHIAFWSVVRAKLKANGVSLSVLLVAYPLLPDAAFPSQFRAAVDTMRYLLAEEKQRPSTIILAGDSAGGNLALATLLQATHPCNLADALPEISAYNQVRGLLLMSPWVSFDTTLGSFGRNRSKDYLHPQSEKRWSDAYVNSYAPSPYNEPGRAVHELWVGLPVDQIMVTAGSDEVLLDGIDKWVQDVQMHHANVTYQVSSHEPHEAPLIWPIFGDRHETETERHILQWLTHLLAPLGE